MCLQLNRWPCSEHRPPLPSAPSQATEAADAEAAEAEDGAGSKSSSSGKSSAVHEPRCGPCFDGWHHRGLGGDGHGNALCKACAPTCWTCSGSSMHECIACAPGYSFQEMEFDPLSAASAASHESVTASPTQRTLCMPNCNNSVNYLSLALLLVAQLWCIGVLIVPIVRSFDSISRFYTTLSSYLNDPDSIIAARAASILLYPTTATLSTATAATHTHPALMNAGGPRPGILVCTLFVGFGLSVVLFDEYEWARDKADYLLVLQICSAITFPFVGLLQTKV
jgi:hypothetical protein